MRLPTRFVPVLITLLSAALFLGWQMYMLPVPEGLSGQPRSSAIPAGWVVPPAVQWFVWLGLLASLLALHSPLWGVAVYCVVSHVVPIHSAVWVYLTWLHLPTMVVLVTLVAWLQLIRVQPELLNNLRRFAGYCCIAIVFWYALTATAVVVSDRLWQPALQLHPLRAFDALVLFMVAATSPVRVKALLLVGITLAVTLMVRVAWLQPGVYLDGDVAALSALAAVILGCLGFCVRAIWHRGVIFSLALACAAMVWFSHNRAALLAVVIALLAALCCGPRRRLGIGVFAALLLVTAPLFVKTDYARRFEAAFTSLDAVTTNSRVLTWVGGLKLAAQNPWTGVGPGHFVHNIGEVAPEYANHTAHNVFVSAAAETGWTGALLLAGLMLGSVFRAAYVALTFQQLSALAVVAGTVAYIVLGMFLSFTFLGVGYFVMGLCLADEARQRRRLVTM